MQDKKTKNKNMWKDDNTHIKNVINLFLHLFIVFIIEASGRVRKIVLRTNQSSGKDAVILIGVRFWCGKYAFKLQQNVKQDQSVE